MIVSVSIIVPMYNAQATISRMLNSIQRQTYTQFEVILIDDGSNDATAAQCQPYLDQDRRFTYHYQPNGGVSSARNLGLSLVTQPYISFLDSDDYIEDDFLELMLAGFQEDHEVDLVNCSLARGSHQQLIPEQLISYQEAINHLPDSNGPMGYMCNKLFRFQIIQDYNIRFNEAVYYGEDILFNMTYLLHARKVKYVPKVLYHYIIQADSKSSNLTSANALTHLGALGKIVDMLETNGLPGKTVSKYQHIRYRIALGYLFRLHGRLTQSERQEFQQLIEGINLSTVPNIFLKLKIISGRVYFWLHRLRRRQWAISILLLNP